MGKINCGGFELGDGLVVENGILKKAGTNTSEVSKLISCGGFRIGEGLTFEDGKLSCSGGGYPEPEGSVTIQTNGTYDVKDKATAIVDVPQPSGNKAITENGTHNVKDYAYAVVNVSGYPEPSGEFTIYSNGYYDCKDYENVDVQVSGAPNINWQEATNNTLDFGDSLEGVNFIIIGQTLDSGVKMIWHEADYWEERDMAVWDGGSIFQKIYDESQLSDGLVVLNDGYNFVADALYRLYWWY